MDAVCKFCSAKFSKKYPAQIFCSLLCSNRYNLNHKNKVVLPSQYSVELAELFGFIKAAVRGLFDTEGSVGMKYFLGMHGTYLYKQLTVTNKNKNILRFLEESLHRFDYKPTKNSHKNIYVSNKKDIQRYLYDIGSSNPKIVRKIAAEEINGYTWRVAPNGKAPVLKTGTP